MIGTDTRDNMPQLLRFAKFVQYETNGLQTNEPSCVSPSAKRTQSKEQTEDRNYQRLTYKILARFEFLMLLKRDIIELSKYTRSTDSTQPSCHHEDEGPSGA